ncbi:MAG: C_GCAxxG_C_C family protein [Gammaproteobacteria bacterium]|nr:C_GCAxxG_C_C family protein [Gammaproteobacteria bacterium]
MTDTNQKSKELFDAGLYCAESVLKAIADEENISSPLIPGIATGFCSGMSRTCNMCGALTGGMLALNIVLGRSSTDETVERNYEAIQSLINGFKGEFGSTNCKELLGCDLGTNEGQKEFSENDLHLKCREYTGKATELAREIINSTKEP